MRVRTGRFEGLGLGGKAGNSQLVEERVGEREMERQRRVVPPPSAVGSDAPGGEVGHAAGDELAIDDPAALPVLELHGAQAMAYPAVGGGKHLGRLCDPEVGLPSRQIRAEV